jgi:hypothetical protein
VGDSLTAVIVSYYDDDGDDCDDCDDCDDDNDDGGAV